MTTTNGSNSQLSFVNAMPGLPEHSEWTLAPVAEDSPFLVLTSTKNEAISFVIVEPGYFFADLTVDVDSATQELLGLTTVEDAIMYVILTLGETLETTTANLLGPLVANKNTGSCVQMIRTQTDDSTKEPILNREAHGKAVEETASSDVVVEEVTAEVVE